MSTDEVLTRAVDKILPSKEGLATLMKKRKITIYLGIDPSNPQIHLGNAVVLRKLRQFQDLGHKVILLIGDFTGMIGDPTNKTATRSRLSKKQVLENAKTYKEQASKILNFNGSNPAEIKFNSQWLSKLTLEDLTELSSHLTVGQLEERDMFVARKKEGKPIFLHEFLYPLMQGYDSVAMDVDLEVGGTDQTFNMLVGRQLMKILKDKEKYVLTVPLLLGTNGQKMGKTSENFISIMDTPADMYGKIMSIRDDLITQYFELTTDVNQESIDMKKPMEAKKKLALEIVKIYHGEKTAQETQSEFEKVHQKGETPESPEEVKGAGQSILEFLIKNNFASSTTVAKNLISSKSIDINNQTVTDRNTKVNKNDIIKIGKKKTVKVGYTPRV
ncbi:tyrosine--tRNA ligase [Candidatus Curtissbacteria bacterium]|nr:tyrosine--tRNA ligase [Candidatus Curtissbacteria bacterium]